MILMGLALTLTWCILLFYLSGGKQRLRRVLLSKNNKQEGLKLAKPKDPTKKIMRQMENTFQKATKPLKKGVNDLSRQATKGFNSVLGKFEGFIQFFVDIFKAIESYLMCGVQKITRLPQCWYYYALEMLGKLYYLPISLVVWMFSLQKVETMVWDWLEALDRQVYNLTSGRNTGQLSTVVASVFGETAAIVLFAPDDPNCPVDPFAPDAYYGPQEEEEEKAEPGDRTGIHLIHFPDSVLDKCYRCNITKFPKPKDYF